MGLNAWAAMLFAIAVVLSVVEFVRTKRFGDLTIAFLSAAIAVAFFAQGHEPLLHP